MTIGPQGPGRGQEPAPEEEETGTAEYYRRRAAEYDDIYAKPDRQADLMALTRRVAELLAGCRVLELAAGTGWWTARYADVAEAVTATDVNPETLAVARRRRAWPPGVRFVVADAFHPELVDGAFDAAFLGFFWSHVARRHLDGLLRAVAGRIETGGLLVALDNRFVGGSSQPVGRRDVWGDSFQVRELSDGSRWEVRKNFPTAEEVDGSLRRVGGTSVTVEELPYYWLGWCRLPAAAA